MSPSVHSCTIPVKERKKNKAQKQMCAVRLKEGKMPKD